jgi:hypothetical protein
MTTPTTRLRLVSGAVLLGLVLPAPLLIGSATTSAGASAGAAGGCTPATNVEAIVDDSGSMSISDPDAVRGRALRMLNDQPTLRGTSLGAIEFGSTADTLFPPTRLPGATAAIDAAIANQLVADNGGTDYNIAFARAQADDPTATARIFITDGGHNVGTYENGHAGGPPTYVLGVGIGAPSATDTDAARLQAIASDTGGVYYPDIDTTNLQATVNKVAAQLSCQAITRTYTDLFHAAGQTKHRHVKVSRKAIALTLTLTWASPLDSFSIRKLAQHGHGHGKASRPKAHVTRGATYVVVRLTRLHPGPLSFVLESTALGSGAGAAGVTLTTQAQSVVKHPAKHTKHHHHRHHG